MQLLYYESSMKAKNHIPDIYKHYLFNLDFSNAILKNYIKQLAEADDQEVVKEVHVRSTPTFILNLKLL